MHFHIPREGQRFMFDSPATFLYRLQTIDQAIVQRRIRLKEITAALGHNEAVDQAQKQVDAALQALKPWQTRARDLDFEIKEIENKIKATEENLYSGRVTSPKALQELQTEIASLKRSQSKLEDQLLEAMVHTEEGQESLNAAQAALSGAQALYANLQIVLQAEKDRLEGELPHLQTQRKEAANGIDPTMLATYDAMRPKKSGNVVALLQDASCSLCRVEQTSSLVNKVQREKTLIYCAACGRILAPRA
jgi:uncharacterized protein